MDKQYWTTFYKNTAFSGPSYFAVSIQPRLAPGSTVIDLGCGEGRDCRYYRSLGFNVIGIDQAVESRVVDRKLRFVQADLADLDGFEVPKGVCFTARFLFQSLSLEEERKLLGWVARQPRGTMLLIEGRAGRLPKYTFGSHYRRAVMQDALVNRIHIEHDMRILQVVNGFWSPFMEENPLVYRIVARTR